MTDTLTRLASLAHDIVQEHHLTEEDFTRFGKVSAETFADKVLESALSAVNRMDPQQLHDLFMDREFSRERDGVARIVRALLDPSRDLRLKGHAVVSLIVAAYRVVIDNAVVDDAYYG